MNRISNRRNASVGFRAIVLVSLLAVVGLGGALFWKPARPSGGKLTIYCAAALEPVVRKIAHRFKEEEHTDVEFVSGNSGSLTSQVETVRKGDLYLPADDSFLVDARKKNLVKECLDLARMKLIVAVKPGNPRGIKTLADLAQKDLTVLIGNNQTAVGRALRRAVGDSLNKWKADEMLTVQEMALGLKVGTGDAALIWDSVARQHELEIAEIAELSSVSARVQVGVLTCSEQPALALKFARYLTAPERGAEMLQKAHYQPIEGDAWEAQPTLILYSGGINRRALEKTLEEFKVREGVEINFACEGCGSLVTKMKTQTMPDIYFSCDRSFMTPSHIAEMFETPLMVSESDMVILVRKGNPKGIESLADLEREEIKVGWAHEKLTALGKLTKDLLERKGSYERLRGKSSSVTGIPTADLLVNQLLATSDALDAVIVYRANALSEKALELTEMIAIPEPDAKAEQQIAVALQSKQKHLSRRLIETVLSDESRLRFEQNGFRWLAKPLSK
jgi:ABC-type molybdate transport system substrate-binding protein